MTVWEGTHASYGVTIEEKIYQDLGIFCGTGATSALDNGTVGIPTCLVWFVANG